MFDENVCFCWMKLMVDHRYTAKQVLEHPWIRAQSGALVRASHLQSPANLRAISPAKSARRPGGWKFWVSCPTFERLYPLANNNIS